MVNGWCGYVCAVKGQLPKISSVKGQIVVKCWSKPEIRPLFVQWWVIFSRPKVSSVKGQICWSSLRFDPYLYSGGSSSAGPTLVENCYCKVVYTQWVCCDRYNVYHTPGARMKCSAFRSIKVVVSRSVAVVIFPWGGAC